MFDKLKLEKFKSETNHHELSNRDLLLLILLETLELRKEIRKEVKQMAIDQATFDTDLAALISAIGSLVSAVNNLPQPAAADFTAEDQAVRNAAAQVADELNKLNPPTPVPAPAPAPETPTP